jgi:hypothetical protein
VEELQDKYQKTNKLKTSYSVHIRYGILGLHLKPGFMPQKNWSLMKAQISHKILGLDNELVTHTDGR